MKPDNRSALTPVIISQRDILLGQVDRAHTQSPFHTLSSDFRRQHYTNQESFQEICPESYSVCFDPLLLLISPGKPLDFLLLTHSLESLQQQILGLNIQNVDP